MVNLKIGEVVIGKRVTVGVAITGLATALAFFFPDYSVPILAISGPVTFILQIWIANRYGITQ